MINNFLRVEYLRVEKEMKDNLPETATCKYCGADFKPSIHEDKYCEEHAEMCREEERDQMIMDAY